MITGKNSGKLNGFFGKILFVIDVRKVTEILIKLLIKFPQNKYNG